MVQCVQYPIHQLDPMERSFNARYMAVLRYPKMKLSRWMWIQDTLYFPQWIDMQIGILCVNSTSLIVSPDQHTILLHQSTLWCNKMVRWSADSKWHGFGSFRKSSLCRLQNSHRKREGSTNHKSDMYPVYLTEDDHEDNQLEDARLVKLHLCVNLNCVGLAEKRLKQVRERKR